MLKLFWLHNATYSKPKIAMPVKLSILPYFSYSCKIQETTTSHRVRHIMGTTYYNVYMLKNKKHITLFFFRAGWESEKRFSSEWNMGKMHTLKLICHKRLSASCLMFSQCTQYVFLKHTCLLIVCFNLQEIGIFDVRRTAEANSLE